jgi:hypothetical protein
MHVSWTTLREQIFAKLRRPYRSEANMNEVGHDIFTIKKLLISIDIPGDSVWYSQPYIFFVLRKKYSKPYIFVNRL